MIIVEQIQVLAKGDFVQTREWKTIRNTVLEAVRSVDWPHGSGIFTIYAEIDQNGVVPIKTPCIQRLVAKGWKREKMPKVADSVLAPGDLDALYESSRGYIGFEWETGNISSSHRAVNKLLWALFQNVLVGAFLVVPSDRLYPYLTQRVGNVRELRPYLPLWQSYSIAQGVFEIIVAEHDATTTDVRLRIPKGPDGNAFRWKRSTLERG